MRINLNMLRDDRFAGMEIDRQRENAYPKARREGVG